MVNLILGNPGMIHSVPTAFMMNAVGTEWITPVLPRMGQPRIIGTIMIGPTSPMLQNKAYSHWPFGSREDFEGLYVMGFLETKTCFQGFRQAILKPVSSATETS